MAAVLASGGTGATGALVGAGASAGESLAGAMMHGGGPPLSGSLVQSLARSLPRSSSSGGSSGSAAQSGESGRSASAAPAPSAKPFNAKDAGNDGEVQQMIDESKQKGGKA